MSRSSSVLWSVCAVAAGLGATACLAANYTDPASPRFSGDFTDGPPDPGAQLVVVTYNLKFGVEVDAAIAALESELLAGADVVAMQEMDPDGVDRIARALSLRYVYYPASVHREHGKDFGNAVLTRWPIASDRKVILPNRDPFVDQQRTATAAVVSLPGGDVLVYSAHTSIPTLGLGSRLEQVQAVIDDAAGFAGPVVIAGDFNTSDPGSSRGTIDLFGGHGVAWASTRAVDTADRWGIGFLLDYVFARGLEARDSGVFGGDAGSDHRPVWAAFDPPVAEGR